MVGPVGFGLTRVGAAPGSEPRGGVVGIAGMSVAGRGAATASPPKARIARLRSMTAGTKYRFCGTNVGEANCKRSLCIIYKIICQITYVQQASSCCHALKRHFADRFLQEKIGLTFEDPSPNEARFTIPGYVLRLVTEFLSDICRRYFSSRHNVFMLPRIIGEKRA